MLLCIIFLVGCCVAGGLCILSVHCYCGGAGGWPWEGAGVIERERRIRMLSLVVVDCYVAGGCFILIVCCCCCGADGWP